METLHPKSAEAAGAMPFDGIGHSKNANISEKSESVQLQSDGPVERSGEMEILDADGNSAHSPEKNTVTIKSLQLHSDKPAMQLDMDALVVTVSPAKETKAHSPGHAIISNGEINHGQNLSANDQTENKQQGEKSKIHETNYLKRRPETSSNEERPSKKNKDDNSSPIDSSLSDVTSNINIEAIPAQAGDSQLSESFASSKNLTLSKANKSLSTAPETNWTHTAINDGDHTLDANALLDSINNMNYSKIIDPSLAELIKLEEIPDVLPLKQLSLRDIAELESSLQIGDKYNHGPDDGWKNDWTGNLQLYEKDIIVNRGYVTSQPSSKPISIPFYDWAAKIAPNSNGLRGIELLFSYVYHMKGTPEMAKKIMAYSLQRPAESAQHRLEFIIDAVRRISYDPVVLYQDGWTTRKAESPEGVLGGAFLIGRRIIWQRYEALVIAFIPDDDFGALWKAVWVEDLDTFDLEAGELQQAMKKWDNKQAKLNRKNKNPNNPSGSTRFAATAKFTVDGIENGIVLAAPTSKAGRGVLWPARVRHVAEANLTAAGNVVSLLSVFPKMLGIVSFSVMGAVLYTYIILLLITDTPI